MRMTVLSLVLLALLMAFGCGGSDTDKRAEVKGTVRINGVPLAAGSISFGPAEGNNGPSSGGRITNGEYHVPRTRGVAIGKNRVGIRTFVNTGRQVERGGGVLEEERVQAIPSKYNDSSELVCDVRPGSNELDFDLKVDLTKYPLAAYLQTSETK